MCPYRQTKEGIFLIVLRSFLKTWDSLLNLAYWNANGFRSKNAYLMCLHVTLISWRDSYVGSWECHCFRCVWWYSQFWSPSSFCLYLTCNDWYTSAKKNHPTFQRVINPDFCATFIVANDNDGDYGCALRERKKPDCNSLAESTMLLFENTA